MFYNEKRANSSRRHNFNTYAPDNKTLNNMKPVNQEITTYIAAVLNEKVKYCTTICKLMFIIIDLLSKPS